MAILRNKLSVMLNVQFFANATELAKNTPIGAVNFQIGEAGVKAQDANGRQLTAQADGSYIGPDGKPAVVYEPSIAPLGTILGGAITADMVGQSLATVVQTLIEAAVAAQPQIADLSK